MSKKLTYEYVKGRFKEIGFELISTEYVNSQAKLKYICPAEHNGSISWGSFKKGYRCKFCYLQKIQPKFEEVKREFSKRGYTLKSQEYKNSISKLRFVCPEGHLGKISWKKFKIGQGCSECFGTKKVLYKDVKNFFSKEGFVLVSFEYINNNRKLKVVCPKGHKVRISLSSFKRGGRCVECSGLKKKSIDFIRNKFSEQGFILLTKNYVNEKSNLDFICPKGHERKITWSNFKKRQSCPSCWFESSVSSAEKEILEFVRKICKSKVIHSDREILAGKELDIFIPEKNLAIEYCGLYWHSEVRGKDKYYHYTKTKMCGDKGIRLITIFEDEWVHRRNFVLSRLEKVFNDPCVVFPKVSGTGVLSDLRWDGALAETRYLRRGFSFCELKFPCAYLIRNKTTRVLLDGLETKVRVKDKNKIWDCGHAVYRKVKSGNNN